MASNKTPEPAVAGLQQQPAEPAVTERTSEELLLDADSVERPALSFVLPTLNEEEGIADCIQRIKAAVADLGLTAEIIVSDSSTDRTPEIASGLGAIVVEPDEAGYGAAYQYAFERARGDYIVMGDADTTYDFEEVPKLFERMAETDADMVMGSRLAGEIKPGAMPTLHQYVGNPLLTKFLNLFYDAGVSDAHSGLRILSRDALEALNLQTTGMEFASEMIMDAAARDLTIEEVPITYHEREGEATLHSFKDGWRHVKFMLINAPGYLFSVPGALFGLFGGLLLVSGLFDLGVAGITPGVHSVIAGSLLVILGFQVASFGVFATIAGDPIREARGRFTTGIVDRLSLEHGATAGLVLLALGTGYALYLLGKWVQSGFSELPVVTADMVAFTAIVLGIQIVFGAFFLSTIKRV